METPNLAALRKKAEKSAEQAEKDKAALYEAAIAAAITSDEYGHLSAIAREAGLVSQHLRDLVERHHPGWLTKAAERRNARKTAAKGKGSRAAAA